MESKLNRLKALAAAVAVAAGGVLGSPVNAKALGLNERVLAVRARAEQLQGAKSAPSDSSAFSGRAEQWVNWGNWGNWSNWADWNNWHNWQDWGNAWANWGNM